MVFCDNLSERNNMADMDKMLEEFLMPPPDSTSRNFVLRNSAESLRDASSSSLDRSNNSSSTNGSWNSSCSCHSMSSLSHRTKSTFVFHKQPILPPLLCSSSRTEMKVYKMKAVEKEQRRKQKEKERLISRVEAILSSVEITPAKGKIVSKQPASNSKHEKVQEKNKDDPCDESSLRSNNSHKNAELIHSHDNQQMDDVSGIHGNNHNSDKDDDESQEQILDETRSLSNGDVITIPLGDQYRHGDESTSPDDDGDQMQSDDVTRFHDNAYRSSLRNLLQKSISLNQSGMSPVNKITSGKASSESKSSSESEADLTENTVIDAKTKSPPGGEESLEIGHLTSKFSVEIENLSEDEETVVELIVETVLKDAKIQLLNENNDESLLPNIPACDVTEKPEIAKNFAESENETICPKIQPTEDIPSWETPKIMKPDNHDDESPVSVTNSQFFDLHNQSTSTKVNFPIGGSRELEGESPSPNDIPNNKPSDTKIDESPILPPENVLELTGTICYDTTVNDAHPNTMVTGTDACPVVMTTMMPNDDLTLLQPVMSQTVSDVTVTSFQDEKEDMKENCDPSMETGSLFSLKRSLSFTLDQPSRTFESAVIEAVSQHFQGIQKDKTEANQVGVTSTTEENLTVVQKKKMLHARVRRGSYTLDEPSPYLVKNKENLTIEPENFDVCSDVTVSTGDDVKRKLDLPSDSEESSLHASTKKCGVAKNRNPSRAELNVVNLCRLLQDQHKNQMENMKRKHQEQLESLQSEIVQGNTKMSLPVDSNAVQPFLMPPHDVTVSPSFASTEYRDIRIGGYYERIGHYDEHPPPQLPSPVESYREMITYQDVDVTRITDVQLTPTLHEKLCKFSALCKGHLTRQLLKSNKVQDILQIVRDTSRLILSLRLEFNESKGMDSVRDTYLEDRLYTQLRSALHHLHNIFFNISTGERMYIVAQSCILEKLHEKKSQKHHQLSTATQKSLERKRLLSTNSDTPTVAHTKTQHKEVKSKISHIWKTEPVKLPEKKSPTLKPPSKSTGDSKKPIARKPIVQSQSKAKSSLTSQNQSMTSQRKGMVSSPGPTKSKVTPAPRSGIQPPKPKSPVKSQRSNVTSQMKSVTSQRKNVMSQQASKVTSQSTKVNQQKPTLTKKTAPLTNRANIGGRT